MLRGVALFGVFLVNLQGFAGPDVMATQEQLLALRTVGWDGVVHRLVDWLVADKANTLFAFLFGVGFSLQMQRAAGRGADFDRVYVRRLTVLLVFGFAHLFFVWTWDILHLYALTGLALFALRRLPDRALLWIGIPLALFGRDLTLLVDGGGEEYYEDAAVLVRQQLAAAGEYLPLLRNISRWNLDSYLLTPEFPAWFLYVLGRFLIGAWVGRQGWLSNAAAFLPGYRRVRRVALPAGLILSGVAVILRTRWGIADEPLDEFAQALHLVATPLLAAGYVAALVLFLRTPRGARLLAPFRDGGRMALSNYVAQSAVYALLLFGVGPGLALGGRIGTLACLGIVIVVYGLQLAASRAWLRSFRYGPLEWAWRTLTYGTAPPLLRSGPSALR